MTTQLRKFAAIAVVLAAAIAPSAVAAWENHDPVFVINPVSAPTVTTIEAEC